MTALQTVDGYQDLDRLLKRMTSPQSIGRMQRVLLANQLEHRDEAIKRSTFSPRGKQNVRHALKVRPDRKHGDTLAPKEIKDLKAETISFWKGYADRPEEGVAATLEKRVGKSEIQPKRARFLAIPAGALLTPSGAPKRPNDEQVQVRDVPNTHVVKGRGRTLLVIQRLGGRTKAGKAAAASKVGFVENLAKSSGSFMGPLQRGERARASGQSERLVGILVRRARVVQNLDFFGAWEALEGKRDARYDSLLDDLVAGRTR